MIMKQPLLFAALLTVSIVRPLPADTVVVFNEIMYLPATNEPGMEWVELRNQMAVDVDISGWSVTGGIAYTFPSNTIVRGGAQHRSCERQEQEETGRCDFPGHRLAGRLTQGRCQSPCTHTAGSRRRREGTGSVLAQRRFIRPDFQDRNQNPAARPQAAT